jgi:hypothetical protein
MVFFDPLHQKIQFPHKNTLGYIFVLALDCLGIFKGKLQVVEQNNLHAIVKPILDIF